jgi:hypothetical protein
MAALLTRANADPAPIRFALASSFRAQDAQSAVAQTSMREPLIIEVPVRCREAPPFSVAFKRLKMKDIEKHSFRYPSLKSPRKEFLEVPASQRATIDFMVRILPAPAH